MRPFGGGPGATGFCDGEALAGGDALIDVKDPVLTAVKPLAGGVGLGVLAVPFRSLLDNGVSCGLVESDGVAPFVGKCPLEWLWGRLGTGGTF